LTLRKTDSVSKLLDKGKVLLHVSQRYPAAQGCIAPVLTVGTHPENPKQRLCFDLRQDPALLLDLSADEIRERLFTPAAELPEGVERIAIKGIKINASPMLAPLGTLSDDAAERWGIDRQQIAAHAARIVAASGPIANKLHEVYLGQQRSQPTDPDLMLYTGGFFSDGDRRRMEQLHARPPQELAEAQPRFDDPRLATLLFRMRARSWPETLTETEREDWDAWRFERLTDPDAGGSLTIDGFEHRIAELRQEHAADQSILDLLDELEDWSQRVMDAGG
jgi:exodeoxyribonuclease-1